MEGSSVLARDFQSLDSESSSPVLAIPETKSQCPQHHEQVESSDIPRLFPEVWKKSTEDNNMSLYGFRRFKTTHLVNLRFMEEEVAKLDHKIYQAGLKLGLERASRDRLGLSHVQRDENALGAEEIVTWEFILKLRSLVREYDDALAAFNRIMTMETFSLLDDQHQSQLRTGLTPREIYLTRLIRVDLGGRQGQDPFQRGIHKYLRRFRYWYISRRTKSDKERTGSASSPSGPSLVVPYQNTVFIAEVLARFAVAVVAGVYLIIPLVILTHQSSKKRQLVTISICVTLFSFLVSGLMKSANVNTIAVAAAYAAVLSVFISNGPGSVT